MPPIATSGLTFGFGLGGNMSATTSSNPSALPSTGVATIGPGVGGTAKRQRSESPPVSLGSDDSYAGDHAQHPQQQFETRSTPLRSLPKRLRAGLCAGATSPSRRRTDGSPPLATTTALSDVGKVLATLDRVSLLTVFSRLLTSDPSLADRIQTLVPTPSLSSVEASLEEAQRAIRAALVNASDMRAEFAWGRLRMPIADFATTAIGFMPFFVEKTQCHDSSFFSSSTTSREAPHPSTTFAYLQLVTERALQIVASAPPMPENLSASLFSPDATNPLVVAHTSGTPRMILKVYQDALPKDRMSAVNPNTIVSQLLPAVLLHWADFVDSVARFVNEEGRMFGADTVRGWLHVLETLSKVETDEGGNVVERDEQKACRTALFAVGQRLHEQIGWLVGRQFEWRSSPGMEF